MIAKTDFLDLSFFAILYPGEPQKRSISWFEGRLVRGIWKKSREDYNNERQ